MIARLSGQIIDKSANSVVVDVGGVGYELLVPTRLLTGLVMDEPATFFVAEHIKEDTYNLMGFATADERAMYYQLTSVNGVGPKAGMMILSAHEVADIQKAISEGNLKIFSDVSGIGGKTAQRIILELKGKLVTSTEATIGNDDQAYKALIALGFSGLDAKQALKNVDPSLDTQTRIKQALLEMGK